MDRGFPLAARARFRAQIRSLVRQVRSAMILSFSKGSLPNVQDQQSSVVDSKQGIGRTRTNTLAELRAAIGRTIAGPGEENSFLSCARLERLATLRRLQIALIAVLSNLELAFTSILYMAQSLH